MSDEKSGALEREEEMRRHEQEARERDADERSGGGGGDRSATGLPDRGEAEPAPPGDVQTGTLTGS